MPRIAILGSCITRDLWPIRGDGAELLAYVSRTSFASLFAPPVKGLQRRIDVPPDLRGHGHNAVLADLEKTAVARLVAFAPTHIIFDFIDERFDLIAAGRAIVTHSAELEMCGYLAQPEFAGARRISRLSATGERLWLEGVDRLAGLIRATPLRDAKLILHSARWATEHRTESGALEPVRDVNILPGQPVDIPPYNALLRRQEAIFTGLMPRLERIDAGPLRVADAAHRWGLSPFHYIPEYYDEVRRQLVSLGLAEAFSGRRSAPIAPAA